MKPEKKPGPPRFGTVDEREKQIVEFILFCRQKPRPVGGKRKTLQEIADHLNATNQLPRRGKRWTVVMVWNTIQRHYQD